MPQDSTRTTTKNQGETTTKSKTKVEGTSNYVNVKNIVLKHLSKYRSELNDEAIEFEPISLATSNSTPIAALELKKKDHEGKDSPELHEKRGKVVDMVQELVEGIKHQAQNVVVVNVNTPAVDLDKKFNEDQLSFMRRDIFSSIEEQLGVKFQEEVEEHWKDAFDTMMNIVESHRRRS